MRWKVRGTGLEVSPEPVVEILEYRHSRFHKLQEFGPLVHVVFRDGERGWVFADELFLDSRDFGVVLTA